MEKLLKLSLLLLISCTNNNLDKIEVLENGAKYSIYYYDNNKLVQRNIYNIETKEIETTVKYIYRDSMVVDMKIEGIDLDYLYHYNNSIENYKYLVDLGISIDNPELMESEINDIVNILSVSEYYITNISNIKTIELTNIHKKLRFYPSYITMLINENEPINTYKLIIKNNKIIKDIFIIKEYHYIQRQYYYNGNKIEKIVYSTSYNTDKLERKFVYTRGGNAPKW